MKMEPEILWLCCSGEHPVGLVRQFDSIEQRWKYYIGVGDGEDLDNDIQTILDWGQTFYDLNFIADFMRSDIPQTNPFD